MLILTLKKIVKFYENISESYSNTIILKIIMAVECKHKATVETG